MIKVLKLLRKWNNIPGLTTKKINHRIKTPGQHGKILFPYRQRSLLREDFKERLLIKQLIKYTYNLTNKQLFNYYLLIKNSKKLTTLIQLLERRLDCILYRLGFVTTLKSAKQLINHGHVYINNKKIISTNFLCNIKDIIKLKLNPTLLLQIKSNIIKNKSINNYIPSHLILNINLLEGQLIKHILPADTLLNINELKVMEYFSI